MRTRTVLLLMSLVLMAACGTPAERTDAAAGSDEGPESRCGSVDYGSVLEGDTTAAAETAREVYTAALACDDAALIEIIRSDDTIFTPGSGTAEEIFAIPSPENRYWLITRLLTLTPTMHADNLYWPGKDESSGAPDWDELLESGLVTPEDRASADDDGVYVGWSITVTGDGRLHWFAHRGEWERAGG